jgi:transglutaminase/protease-like cytokinesis protein 3
MREAAECYQNEIDVSDLGLKVEEIYSLFEWFVSDNPQYFWIAPTYGAISKGDSLIKICLEYTDGVNSDNGDSVADRAVIAARRAVFDARADEILATIDPALSDYEKELLIHDYLTKSIHYATAVANDPYANGATESAFCAYGALIDGYAVCEGYTEAFQYLCYRVGINASQVLGYGHVWNVVQIGGEWYQIDVTWDDPINQFGTDGDGRHTFFNLTSAEMYAAHPRTEESALFVPDCTATEYAYQKESAAA